MTDPFDEVDVSLRPISIRASQLNQLLLGRTAHYGQKDAVGMDGLLDSLFVLFDECNKDGLLKNQYISTFVNKYTKIVSNLRSLRVSINDFEVKGVIGRGHFGEVRVVREKSTGDVYALKVLQKTDTLAQQNVLSYEEERDIMAKSHSKWITQLHFAFQDHQCLYLVMDFHPGGDLLSLLARYEDVFEESMARFYLAEMIVAIHSLHTMGYVHRDIKPENILLDWTGHIKLADFGSACRLGNRSSTAANMPVGTPDYICPEVLTTLNEVGGQRQFGVACDWWSLGICAYEMLYGKTPFTDNSGSMVSTYASIMNHASCLHFPTDMEVSDVAKDLIKGLLTDVERRLGYQQICIHQFFEMINFDDIIQMAPPFIPTVLSKDDTSNFEEFDKARPKPFVEDSGRKAEFTGKDLPFIGFTFTKHISTDKPPSLTHEVSSPACRSSLERRLSTKSHELQELREKFKNVEHRLVAAECETRSLRGKLTERERQLDEAEIERNAMERESALCMTEANSMKRLLELEKADRLDQDSQAVKLFTDIQQKYQHAQTLRDEQNTLEQDEMKEVYVQLEEESQSLRRKTLVLEKELRRHRNALTESSNKIAVLQKKLKTREKVSIASAEVTAKLSIAIETEPPANNVEVNSVICQLNEDMTQLMASSLAQMTELKQRLDESEEMRQRLEDQVCHVTSQLEEREDQLRTQGDQQSHLIQELKDSLEKNELARKKAEKTFARNEDHHLQMIQELEDEIESSRSEQSNVQEQSLLVFEENEERLKRIKEQERTVALLTFQVTMLEERASLQRQTEESHPGTSVAVGTPHRVRSMAVGTSDYNMAPDMASETVVERVYNSSTLVRLRNQNVSPRRSVKQRQTRSDQVQADLVIPSDLIRERYSDSSSNLSVMVTVTRKRSEQGQGDGPDLDAASDEDAPSSRVPTGRGKVSRKDDEDVGSTETPDVVTDEERREVRGSYPRSTYSEKGVGVIEDARSTRAQAGCGKVSRTERDKDVGSTETPDVVTDKERREVRGSYPRSTYSEKGVGVIEDARSTRAQAGRGKVSRTERDKDVGWSESPDEECQYEGKEAERDVRGRHPRSMDRDMGVRGRYTRQERSADRDVGVRGRYTRQERSMDRERGVGIDQECQYEGTVNERDGRGSYPRRERSTDRERGVGVDQECQYEGTVNERDGRRSYPRRERSTDRERGVGVDQECQYEGTVNERDGRRSYPRREKSTDREKGMGVDQECPYKGKEDVREVRGRYPRQERSREREKGMGVDQECQYEGKEDPLMVSFTCQTEEDLCREGTNGTRLEKEHDDLEQERHFLKVKVDSLESEVAQYKESTHQQRIRALDLKHELQGKTARQEIEIKELRQRLEGREESLQETKDSAEVMREKEASLREKHDELRMTSRREMTRLQEERDDLEIQLNIGKSRYTALEASSAELKKSSEELETELRRVADKCAELGPRNSRLESTLKLTNEEKTRHMMESERMKQEAERSRQELAQKRRDTDLLEQQLSQLKSLAAELEAQVQDYETLNENYEKKETKWNEDRSTYEKAVDERDTQLEQTQRDISTEKQLRQRGEEKERELTSALDDTSASHRAESDQLRQQLTGQKTRALTLNSQLTEVERTRSILEVDNNSLKRRLAAMSADTIQVKEELTVTITKVNELKCSNLKLGRNLEDAMDRYEMLANQKTDLENKIESMQVNFDTTKFKLDSVLSQQTKLIDYLQMKVENPVKKKKLFGTRRRAPPSAIQFRELQCSLEHEREKSSTLRHQITKLRDELYESRTESIRIKSDSTISSAAPSGLSSIIMSPSVQPVAVPTDISRGYRSRSPPSGPTPCKERMHHKIPHRFVTGLNGKATKCAVCLGSVHFVKLAAKCQECNIICHPKCAPSLLATCGLPSEYVKHFMSTLSRARAISSARLSVADLRLQLQGWMKMPRQGKQIWERRWVLLENNYIYIYLEEGSTSETSPVEEFDLCPANGEVSVHSAVTAVELNNTAASDLPYILRLEFEPNTTCWPGRSICLMALTFAEKQKWVATLEAIVNHSGKEERINKAKILGKTIVQVTEEPRLEINCVLPLRDQVMLVGADDGLYVLLHSQPTRGQELVKVEGLNSVYAIASYPGLDVLAVITEKERRLVTVNVHSLKINCDRDVDLSVSPCSVHDITACTTLSWGSVSGAIYLCAATADNVVVMRCDYGAETLTVKKDIVIKQPCSCMYFGKNYIIIGTDRFYKIDAVSYVMSEMLSMLDPTLAFAAFGAAHYDSFPIAVLPVALDNELEEFLLCFNEFGVFVNCGGRRSRQEDIRWSGLPLTFSYEAPYLYITYFNTLQVMQILPAHCESPCGSRTFINIFNPRYLGSAITPGAVYIGSSHDNSAEVICFKGNSTAAERDAAEGNDSETFPLYSSVTKREKSRLVTPRARESGFVSPDDSSPTPIRRMSSSPSQRRRHRHKQSASSLKSNKQSASSLKSNKQSASSVKSNTSSNGVSKLSTQPRSHVSKVKATTKRPDSTDSDDSF